MYIGKPFTEHTANDYAAVMNVNMAGFHHITPPMHASEFHEALGAFNPVGRLGETSDIAEAILFLDSAPFVIGVILHVDGGQSGGH